MSGSTRTRSSFGLKVRRSCWLKRMRTSHAGLLSVPIAITTGTATTTITTDVIMTDAITTAIKIEECGGAGFPCAAGSFLRRIRLPPRFSRFSRDQCSVECCLAVCLTGGAVTPCSANPISVEPTRESCEAAVKETRVLAAALPADDLSRYFAERDLHQATIEAGNGEFDDCLDMTARATDEIKERRHTLQPGEKLKVLQSNE